MNKKFLDVLAEVKEKQDRDRQSHFSWNQDDDDDFEVVDDRSHGGGGEEEHEKPKKQVDEELIIELHGADGKVWNRPVHDEVGHSVADHKPSDREKEHHASNHKKLTDGQKRAIDEYKTDSHEINRVLRKSKGQKKSKLHDHLTAATSNKTKHESYGYRGMGGTHKLDKLKVGAKIKDHGFTSVSHSHSTALAFSSTDKYDREGNAHTFVAKIHMPKGTKAHHFDNSAAKHAHKHEKETVIHHGTTYRVTGHTVHVNKYGNHHHIVHMTVHHQK